MSGTRTVTTGGTRSLVAGLGRGTRSLLSGLGRGTRSLVSGVSFLTRSLTTANPVTSVLRSKGREVLRAAAMRFGANHHDVETQPKSAQAYARAYRGPVGLAG
jgi:hypothetical protein